MDYIELMNKLEFEKIPFYPKEHFKDPGTERYSIETIHSLYNRCVLKFEKNIPVESYVDALEKFVNIYYKTTVIIRPDANYVEIEAKTSEENEEFDYKFSGTIDNEERFIETLNKMKIDLVLSTAKKEDTSELWRLYKIQDIKLGVPPEVFEPI